MAASCTTLVTWQRKWISDLFEVRAAGDIEWSRWSQEQGSDYPFPVYANGRTDAGLHGYASYAVEKGDAITLTARGTPGELGFAFFRASAFTPIGRLLVLRSKGEADALFFANYINGMVRFAQENTGVAQLTAPQVTRCQVDVPPLPEQRAIAKVLSDVDALLGGLTRMIAKKRDLKQATMQQLLTGQTRLPGFSGEWEVKRIGEFTDCIAGGTPSTKIAEYWNGAIPWMNSGELNLKQVYAVEGRITEAGLANSSTKMIPAKCVLIGLAGQGKTRGTVAINHFELCTNQSIAAVFPNESFIPEYLYYNLDNRYDELRELSTGDGGRGGLNLRIIKAISLPFPAVAEQTAIAAVLSDMDAELAALDTRLTKTRALKQAMMSELLTGKTRLPT